MAAEQAATPMNCPGDPKSAAQQQQPEDRQHGRTVTWFQLAMNEKYLSLEWH